MKAKNTIHGFSYGDIERKTVTIHFNNVVPDNGYTVKELIKILKKTNKMKLKTWIWIGVAIVSIVIVIYLVMNISGSVNF